MQIDSTLPGLRQKLAMRPFIRWGYALILILILTIGVWGTFTQIQSAVISVGQVEAETGRHVVQHKYGGDVDEILVKENDEVKQGQVLIRLNGTEIVSQLAATELNYYETSAQTDRLRSEAAGQSEIQFDQELLDAAPNSIQVNAILESQRSLFDARKASARDEKAQLEEQVRQFDSLIANSEEQIASLETQKANNDEEVARLLSLKGKNLTTTGAINDARNTQSQIQSNLISARSNLASYQSQRDQAQSQLTAFDSDRLEEIYSQMRDAEAQRNTYRESLIQLRDQRDKLEIMSPNDGRVYGMEVNSVEAVITPAEPIMYVIPDDADFIIKSRVSPDDVDDVYVGQRAEITFSGLRLKLLPKINGKVQRISADSFVDERTGVAYFEVETKIDDNEMEKLGDSEIQPGMPAEVFIIKQSQTPFAYLTSPARKYFDYALR